MDLLTYQILKHLNQIEISLINKFWEFNWIKILNQILLDIPFKCFQLKTSLILTKNYLKLRLKNVQICIDLIQILNKKQFNHFLNSISLILIIDPLPFKDQILLLILRKDLNLKILSN